MQAETGSDRILHCVVLEATIAPGGFEPPFSDPKTDVLPLDEGALRRERQPNGSGRPAQQSRTSLFPARQPDQMTEGSKNARAGGPR